MSKSYFGKETPDVALKSLFYKYDVDGSGRLDKNELYTLLEDDLGLTENQSDIYRHLLDKDADGLISYPEFQSWFHSDEKFRSINDKTRYHYLRRAVSMFKQYDLDDNLAIDPHEFHKLYKELGGSKDKIKESKALKEMVTDNNGRVSFVEFLKWLNWLSLEELELVLII